MMGMDDARLRENTQVATQTPGETNKDGRKNKETPASSYTTD
jgi:hypothetical protein